MRRASERPDLRSILDPHRNALAAAVVVGAVFVVSLVTAYLIPILETPAPAAKPAVSAAERSGRTIYDVEGCAYCHTQQIRPVAVDLGLGPAASAREDDSRPSAYGVSRLGPDLGCYGDRGTAERAASTLRAPAGASPVSKMPPYRHLDDKQIDNLVAYLVSLRCE